MKTQALLQDLRYQIGVVFREAKAGSEPAREWLVSSFPGHVDFFLILWNATSEAGQTKKSCTRCHGKPGGTDATTTAGAR